MYTPLGRHKHENALIGHALGHKEIFFFSGGEGGREGSE